MKLSVEILDHIFSFLVSHETLDACSKDPVLSPIVDRHLYCHITVYFGQICPSNFSSDRVSKLVSENPRILYYVQVLRIRVSLQHSPDDEDLAIKNELDRFAKTLLMFPVLQCIVLDTSRKRLLCWPDVFRAALEDRLSLPTVKSLHITGYQDFPCSLIDNRKNIKKLVLSRSFTEARVCNSTFPQLKSLTLLDSDSLDVVEPHIKELQSLKCGWFSVEKVSELLGVCSQTLNKLDIDLGYSCYSTDDWDMYVSKFDKPLSGLSPIPPNLQQLTIRATVRVESLYRKPISKSNLPATAEIINLFVSSLQHLILDIDIDIFGIYSNLAKVDFSPLAVLGAAALSMPRIDLYIHTDILPSNVTLAQLLFSLEDHEDITESIKEGILIIHSEKRLVKEEYVR